MRRTLPSFTNNFYSDFTIIRIVAVEIIVMKVGWLVVLGFNATLTTKVISWRSMTHMCFLAFSHQYLHNFSFQSHRLLFSHASAEVGGENTPERKFASTGDRTYNHQVMSPTRSSLSHPGGAVMKGENTGYHHFSPFNTPFSILLTFLPHNTAF